MRGAVSSGAPAPFQASLASMKDFFQGLAANPPRPAPQIEAPPADAGAAAAGSSEKAAAVADPGKPQKPGAGEAAAADGGGKGEKAVEECCGGNQCGGDATMPDAAADAAASAGKVGQSEGGHGDACSRLGVKSNTRDMCGGCTVESVDLTSSQGPSEPVDLTVGQGVPAARAFPPAPARGFAGVVAGSAAALPPNADGREASTGRAAGVKVDQAVGAWHTAVSKQQQQQSRPEVQFGKQFDAAGGKGGQGVAGGKVLGSAHGSAKGGLGLALLNQGSPWGAPAPGPDQQQQQETEAQPMAMAPGSGGELNKQQQQWPLAAAAANTGQPGNDAVLPFQQHHQAADPSSTFQTFLASGRDAVGPAVAAAAVETGRKAAVGKAAAAAEGAASGQAAAALEGLRTRPEGSALASGSPGHRPDSDGFPAACMHLQLPVAVASSWWQQEVQLLQQHLLRGGIEEKDAATHGCRSLAEVGG